MIPYSRQDVTDADVKAVVKVLKSDFITQGKEVPRFEKKICEIVKSKYATAVNSATSALHISCLALGLKKNDYLWTSANSFVASANCGLYCGASIDLIDINLDDFNLCIKNLEKKLIIAKKNNKLPKIIVTVHFSGQPTHQEKIYKLSKKYKFKIIEDASHSLGASRKGEMVGSCKWSDITVFSFHPVKIITTGEGGVATTNSKKINDYLKSFRNHGIIRDKNRMEVKSQGPWYFEQKYLGLNYRMTDIQAALGISQLKRLDMIVKKRNAIAKNYNRKLSSLPIKMVSIQDENISSFHLYPIMIKNGKKNKKHLKIFNYLKKKGINVGLHYIPIYKHPYFKRFKFKSISYPNTQEYYSSAMSLPIFFELSNKQINYICDELKKATEKFS
jgi:UDP-4-amino-4,6-dideoxy-N-acetyl-beta-L-altrosamine transaminase